MTANPGNPRLPAAAVTPRRGGRDPKPNLKELNGMTAPDTAPDRYDVTIYLADGTTETHEGVSAARADELEGVFGSSENVLRIDVCQA